jgi:GT2 family glycosyltransferase
MVSAYVPCYNNRATVVDPIRSIQRQTVVVSDIFVLDDGSSDGSPEVVEAAGVRVLRHHENLGRGAVRAHAMMEAKHELVLCCDATNVLANDFVEKALPWFRDERVAAVFGRFAQPLPRNAVERWRGRHLFKLEQPAVLQHEASLSTHGTMVRASAVKLAGGFNEKLRHTEDGDLGKRLIARGFDVIYDPQLTVTAIGKNSLGQVLERYWRWYAGTEEKTSFIGYAKTIWYAAKVMMVQDLREGDLGAAAISLVVPHYQFWRSWLRRRKTPKKSDEQFQ